MSEQRTGVQELSQAGAALESLLETLLSEVPEYQEAPAPAQPVADLNVSEPLPIQEIAEPEPAPVSVRPAWAEGDLKVLVVRVGELRVAVPLVRLSSISPAGTGEDVLHLPAQHAWHRGVMTVREQQLVRVDPVALLGLATERQESAYLLVIDDGRYGLEVDAMEEPLTLDSDGIRWRQQGEGREWTLGALPEQMRILLDLDAITHRLNTK